MRVVTVNPRIQAEQCEALIGEFLGDASYDEVIADNCRVVREDGSALAVFVRGAVPQGVCANAVTALRSAAMPSDNRGMAAGKGRIRKRRRDGTLSKTARSRQVESGIVGSFDRYPRIPYCRRTAWTMAHPEQMARLVPIAQEVSRVFKENVPGRWQVQADVCAETVKDWVIPNTVFTTMTINRNWQTAVHRDAGDLAEGFGCLAVGREGVAGDDRNGFGNEIGALRRKVVTGRWLR